MSALQMEPLGEVWMLVRDPKKIRKLMVIQGISRRKMAERLGWSSHGYLGRILNGKAKNIDTDTAAKISKILGVGVDDLFLVRASNDNGRNSQKKSA